MIREILFKAKRKDSNEWVEGYYAKLGYGKNVKHFIIQNVFLQEDISYFEDIEINPSTLSQYTGLNDNTKWDELTELEKELFLSNWNYQEDRKNKVEDWEGKRIWENDIVKWRFKRVWKEDYHISQVVWDSFYSAFKISVRGGLAKLREDIEYEIIGNVFDNADLLEVE